MDKLNKQKILAAVLIIALFAALVGTVSLFYNAIDMFINAVSSGWYEKIQQPLAIIVLLAAVIACVGVGGGIASFIVKTPEKRKVCLILAICTAAAFIVFIIAAVCVYYIQVYNSIIDNGNSGKLTLPYNVYNSVIFSLYSGVMAALIQQLVYFSVVTAALLINLKIEKKQAVASVQPVEQATETAESSQNSEEIK